MNRMLKGGESMSYESTGTFIFSRLLNKNVKRFIRIRKIKNIFNELNDI